MKLTKILFFRKRWGIGWLVLLLAVLVVLPGRSSAAPTETLVSATVDVIVAIDTTGSMSGWINQVRTETASFANKLQAEGFDYRLGLLDFKDVRVDGGPWWYGMTKSSATFNSWVNGLRATGGGDWPESDINAMYTATQKFQKEGRSTAGRMLILITDAPFISSENGYDARGMGTFLHHNNVVLNIIGTGADAWGQATQVTSLTAGAYYNTNDLRSAYEKIISQIQKNTPPKVEDSKVTLPPGVDPGSITPTTDLEFTLTGSDKDGDVLRYYWAGLSPSERTIFLGSTPTIHVRLTEPGVWEVTGTATDPTGESVSVTHRIAVGNRKPSVSNLRIDSANSITPTLFWNYADPDGHPQEKVQLRVKKGDEVVWDSGEVPTADFQGTVRGMAYGGDYTVEVRAMDRYDAWSDWTSLPVHINGLPDLFPVSLTTTPSESVLDQETVTVNVQVKNEGEQAAGTFRVSLYDDGNLVGEQTVASVRTGENRVISFSYQASNPTTHSLKAIVDTGKQVTEANEANNEITGSVRVLHRVDLVPSISFLPADTIPQGGTFTARITVQNVGQGDAGTFQVDVYRDGTRILQKTFDRLATGATASFNLENLPAQTAGMSTFKVVADAASQLAEAREDNNTVEAKMVILAPLEVNDIRFTPAPDGRSITIHWQDPADTILDHVELVLSGNGTGEGTPIRVEKGVQQATFAGLQPETSYSIRMQTVNTFGAKSSGIVQTVTTPKDTVPAGDVKDVRATSGPQGRSIQVQWTDPADDDYRLAELRLLSNEGNVIGDPVRVAAGMNRYVFERVKPATDYVIEIHTVDASGNRSTGVKVPVRTGNDTLPPKAVDRLAGKADKQTSTLQVTWKDPADPDLEAVLLLLKEDREGAEWTEAVRIPKGKETAVLKPKPNQTYVIRAIAVDDAGNRSEAADTRAALLLPKPLAPVDIRFSKWGKKPVIQWREAGNLLPVTYNLYRQVSGEEMKKIASLPAGTTRYEDPFEWESSQQIHYYVTTVDADGTESDLPSPVGPIASFTGSPILRLVQASSTDVRFENTVVKGADEYILERRETGDWQQVEKVSATGDTVFWTDRGVQPSHRYQYRVVAQRGSVQAVSPPVLVTVPAGEPSMPIGVEAKAENGKIRVSWQPPAADSEAYNLYRQVNEGPVLLLASRIKDGLQYVDESAKPGMSYTYYVSAWKDGKESDKAASAPVRLETSPSTGWDPKDGSKESASKIVQVKQVGESVRISWQAAKGTPAHYFVYRQEAGSLYQKLIAVLTGDRLQFVDTTAELERTYTYSVQAQYRETYGSTLTPKLSADPIQVVPLDGFSPSKVFDPVNVKATVDERTVLLTWEVPKAAEEYLIYRKFSGEPIRTFAGRVSGDKGTLFTDTSVKAGAYEYVVVARYPAGNSAMVKSNAISLP
ncbi:CARDB domain-containing protein [Effusibacillus consociatus]|uniref:CARDB domain-containing protein n=1 Tax=Effusibacillus consociatus TaxID=1117041 RepID=A0ABV9PYN6_9BACL